jgi:hypothetical protein
MVVVAVLFLAGPVSAYHDEYDDGESHPLRIAAYALHPVGFTLEWLIFRPIHALVSQPELEPIFGHYRPHDWDFQEGMPQVSEVTVTPPPAVAPPPPPPPAVSAADVEAARRAAEEARAAAEEAKRAADEAARAAEKSIRGFEKSLQK